MLFSQAELDKLDKALIEDAAVFLADTVVPKMVEDFSILNSSPLDGLALTEIMHARGVNMRYDVFSFIHSLCFIKTE